MKPVQPDEKLAKVVGEKPLPRTELTKKLWAYIRRNGLQDAKKRTLINGDENLKAYPLEDSDLTLSSVLRNPLLYQEGWGIEAIKHSLT